MPAPKSSEPPNRVVRFRVADLAEQLAAFVQRWPRAKADRSGLTFVTADATARLRMPLLAPRMQAGEAANDYLARLPGPAERHVLLLLQAGAMAVGYWDGDELLHHKAVRRYVVRGHGKAQSLHRKTAGKSRYGSRLRLQNWAKLLAETAAKLHDYEQEYGAPERFFFAVPVRVWSELEAVGPPAFATDEQCRQRVPMHVHRPDFAELQRVHDWLGRGRVELPGDGSAQR